MSERIDPFADLANPPTFATKPKAAKPVEETAISLLAEQNNFPSRQATKSVKPERRKPRTHRTGRNVQFNSKVTAETNAKIYKLADERKVTLGELLEMAMAALEREGASGASGQ
jgi:hypothetical protein